MLKQKQRDTVLLTCFSDFIYVTAKILIFLLVSLTTAATTPFP